MLISVHLAYLFKSKKKNDVDPFKSYMHHSKKMMKLIATSQTSRFKNRKNTSGMVIKDNFDDLDNRKKKRKVSKIVKNPRFYNNVKNILYPNAQIKQLNVQTYARTSGLTIQERYSQSQTR